MNIPARGTGGEIAVMESRRLGGGDERRIAA